MLELKENLYFVGAINPNLRVFDIIMKTEFGTSYNAYLLMGDKVALVETIHDRFTQVFLKNIREIVDPARIDYIIMNHTEPDHSGSISALLDLNPNLTVVGTAAALKNVANVTNRDFQKLQVKTGDKLDLGQNLEMEFILSPNLHWPDSMFTYLPSRKTVFTCDFLGSHYCEPMITDDEISYPEAYQDAFLNYYSAIFGPFKKFVLDGLDRLEKLDFDMVCTSHGPVLKNTYPQAMKLYREWSTVQESPKNVAIFYVSAYGYTRMAAKEMARVLEDHGIPAKTYDVIRHDPAELVHAMEKASGLMFGSPTINRDAVRPIWDLLACVDAVTQRGKPCAVFGSYGWSGEGCGMLASRCDGLGLKRIGDPLRFLMKPSDEDLSKARALAEEFAAAL